MTARVVELGCPGHLIVANACRWRRHTQIGKRFRVSTLGDYFSPSGRATIGSGPTDFFETMVFRTGRKQVEGSERCGCLEVADWSELECQRYTTAGEAQRGHERMVAKYAKKVD